MARRTPAVLVGLCVIVSTTVQTQNGVAGNPHLQLPRSTDPELVRVGDMLFEPSQLAALQAPARNTTQAHLIDYRFRVWWESGVIPYSITPEFSAAERDRILSHMSRWARVAPLVFVERTTQTGFLDITREDGGSVSPCYSSVGQIAKGVRYRLNLGSDCGDDSIVGHELGHAIGLLHEHQRADRDEYISIDYSNIADEAQRSFEKYTFPLVGPYDFGSIMHYNQFEFAVDRLRPTLIPHAPYQSSAATMGTAREPSATDGAVVALFYELELLDPPPLFLSEPPRMSFQRGDLLLAMERLHAFYMSRMGLHRPQGLSINGRPDFLGIAQWIFDIYIPARSAGIHPDDAFDYVKAAITQSDEWRQKNPQWRSLPSAPAFTAAVRLDRDEYLGVLERLDRFYAAPEGLQRPQGLSIAGGPDFLGIATWVFDIYLNERLRGTSANAAWILVENAIRATDEWRSKH
jgi:Astacin (Peptidase family M12A)